MPALLPADSGKQLFDLADSVWAFPSGRFGLAVSVWTVSV